MAFLSINKVAIKGISAAVPSKVVDTIESYSAEWGDPNDFIESTGIRERRMADENTCASDLCVAACERLISELGWDKSEIGAVIFVTQTPDYLFVPATACIIQDRLALPTDCLAFDVTLGCSGWVYGLSVVASLMQTGQIKKAILLAGDTPLKHNSPLDKGAFPLFGDAGTATALEYTGNDVDALKFVLGSDGSGAEAIIIREGGFRHPFNEHTLEMKDYGEGHIRNGVQGEMDGMSVFSFAISKVPKALKSLMERVNVTDEDIDMLTLHQANNMINEKIVKKIKVNPSKMCKSLEKFGNTSSASIPLSMIISGSESLRSSRIRHLASGFGVGLSWGGVLFETNKIAIPEIVEI